jgi:hypothetical protein
LDHQNFLPPGRYSEKRKFFTVEEENFFLNFPSLWRAKELELMMNFIYLAEKTQWKDNYKAKN